jgi:hypothetical protein
MKKRIFSPLLFVAFLFGFQPGFAQYNSKYPSFSAKRHSYQYSRGKKWFTADVFTNLQALQDNKANLGLQLQSEQLMPFLGLSMSASYNAQVTELEGYQNRLSDFSTGVELRYYPFQMQKVFFKKVKPKPQICNGKYGCLGESKKLLPVLLSGFYVAPGYQFRKINTEYIPGPGIESPIDKFPFQIKSHGASLSAGYMVRISRFTLGANYGYVVSQPKWSGPADIFGDLNTTTYPVEFRVEKMARIEVGFNF